MKTIKTMAVLSALFLSICLYGCSNYRQTEKEMRISSYDRIIDEVAGEVFSVDDTYSHHYIIYDIDKNDSPELFVKRGKSQSDYVYQIYSYSKKSKKAELIGEINAFHVGAVFGSKSGGGQFYTSATHMGILMVNKYTLSDGKISFQTILQSEFTDDLALDFMEDAVELDMFALNDSSGLR